MLTEIQKPSTTIEPTSATQIKVQSMTVELPVQTREWASPQSPEEQAALQTLQALLSEKHPTLLKEAMNHAAPQESENELLLRFLRARKNIPQKSLEMMRDDIEWRQSFYNGKGMEALRLAKPKEVLGCDEHFLSESFPHGFIGYDRIGRPIIYKLYGSFLVSALTKYTTMEKLIEYDVWLTEKAIQLLDSRQQSFVIIIDVKGMGLKHVAPTQLTYSRALADAGAPHYPERLGSMYIVNAPKIFCWAFKTIESWLDPRTTEKINLCGGKNDFMPRLKKIMDVRLLPTHVGGEGTLDGAKSMFGDTCTQKLRTQKLMSHMSV